MDTKVTTQPYKGARDFYPEDMQIRNYMFNIWSSVCESYGFQEYDFPILEPFELFAAKTGEEIVNEQLFSFEDKAGRKLAMRPEITPGTVRMLAKKYHELVKPVRWFMIGNNWRFEKPQKGRGREFYQLEVNVFGEEGVRADFEVFEIIISIMKAFGATSDQFSVHLSDRRLISALLGDFLKLDKEKQVSVRRLMDKWKKLKEEAFKSQLTELGLDEAAVRAVEQFMKSDFDNLSEILPKEILQDNQGYSQIQELFGLLNDTGLNEYVSFDPSIIRGFDYSDGLVYEVFDKNPDNRRSMFGGERFDKLINIFDDFDLPATGFAMGDITLLEFLRGWELLPDFESKTKVYVTLFDQATQDEALVLAGQLRAEGINTVTALKIEKLNKQFKFADRMGIPYVVVIGPDEVQAETFQLKDMKTGEQEELNYESLLQRLK
ncbi:MAG: histidine--tRNA ligase [Candidatus Dojkabacteria bacterium]